MLRIVLVAALFLAGSAFASPYGPRPGGRTPEIKPPTHRTPAVPPGVPQSVLNRTQPGGEGFEQSLEERIEEARERERLAHAEVLAAMAELEEAEAREQRAHRNANDAADHSNPSEVDTWLEDAEHELYEAQQELGEIDEEVELLLGEYRDAEEERRSIEGLARDSEALGDILQGAVDAPSVAAGLPAVAAAAPAPEPKPDPTPEQKAHAAYRKALDAFADGEASFGDVESAYIDLQMARDDAGW